VHERRRVIDADDLVEWQQRCAVRKTVGKDAAMARDGRRLVPVDEGPGLAVGTQGQVSPVLQAMRTRISALAAGPKPNGAATIRTLGFMGGGSAGVGGTVRASTARCDHRGQVLFRLPRQGLDRVDGPKTPASARRQPGGRR
jgi:hypothetical protein